MWEQRGLICRNPPAVSWQHIILEIGTGAQNSSIFHVIFMSIKYIAFRETEDCYSVTSNMSSPGLYTFNHEKHNIYV